MTIKGPPIDSTQTGEVWEASAAVTEEALMPSVCPRPLTTLAPLIGAQYRERLGARGNQRLRDSLQVGVHELGLGLRRQGAGRGACREVVRERGPGGGSRQPVGRGA